MMGVKFTRGQSGYSATLRRSETLDAYSGATAWFSGDRCASEEGRRLQLGVNECGCGGVYGAVFAGMPMSGAEHWEEARAYARRPDLAQQTLASLSPRKFVPAGKWEAELSWIIFIVMDRSDPLSLRAPLLL